MINKEKEDLSEPLADWSKDDLNEVVLYGTKLSPPVCKIMSILKYHNVKYTHIETKKRDSEYQKIPVLMLNGRQINDSFIMVKNLSKILDNKELTEKEVQFESEMTFGFMIATEILTLGTKLGMKEYAKKNLDGCCKQFCICLLCYGCCIAPKLNQRVREKNSIGRYDEVDVDKYLKMIEERLSRNDFLQGPNIKIQDLSLYGMLYRFAQGQPLTFI